ncbi:MAG: CPBP family intramembrane metalloprotease [Candidatus Heimdallarchaeota archaeon]|nr:CPBP family intramembrane metalloprotease [Candidatus Heimdallarchaeota archaeon]MCK4878975.1 CPBP family intramembrane metalloprotease [Candidatus Heimdallarchaeota archaeon]
MSNEIIEVVKEIEEPKKENIWFLILGVLILYGIILVFANNVLGRIVSSETLEAKPYLYQINLFVILLVFFLIIVPFLFRIPERNLTILQYLKKIRISKIQPIFAVLGLGIITGVIFLAFLLLSSLVFVAIIGGELILDFRLLWVGYGFSEYLYRALIPGIWEEVAFRGIVLVLLLKKYSKQNSIIINSIMFGLFHLINLVNMRYSPNPEVVALNVIFQVVYTTAAGFVFAYLFVKTESLIPSILSHYILDAFGPFLQTIAFGTISLADLAILRTSQTVLGIGFVPAFVNALIIYLVYRLWKKKRFFEPVSLTNEIQETHEDINQEIHN